MTRRELKKYVREFRDEILDGRKSDRFCFMVCAPLASLLNVMGIDVELIEGDWEGMEHFWLRLPDGTIIDPTADQFGLTPVYIGPKPKKYRETRES